MPELLPAGFGVLVTRPRDQADELIDAVLRRGGRPIAFPLLDIRPRDPVLVAAEAAALPAADISIFVSRNAVVHGLAWAQGRLAAIGPTTAAEIEARGRAVDISPRQGFDSESLLAEPAFGPVRGLIIRILRGDPGREHLASELRQRGARVDYLQAYTRSLPAVSSADRQALADQCRQGGVGAVVVMSIDALHGLEQLLPEAVPAGGAGPLLVTPAARVLKELKLHHPDCPAVLAAGPRAEDLLDAIAGRLRSAPSRARQPD